MKLWYNIANAALSVDYIAFSAILTLLLVSFVIFLCFNAYRNVNRQVAHAKKFLRLYLSKNRLVKVGGVIPPAYKHQWKIYTYTAGVKPSEVLTFNKQKQTSPLFWVNIACLAVAAFYVACYFVNMAYYRVIAYAVCYALCFALLTCLVAVIKRLREKTAYKTFYSFLMMLDCCFNRGYRAAADEDVTEETKEAVRDTISQIDIIRGAGGPNVLARVSEVLREKGLDTDRSVDEQKLLNAALNGLLQSMANQA
jgi:hypothetical protein